MSQKRIEIWIAALLGGETIGAAALECFGKEAVPAAIEALKDSRARATGTSPDPKPLPGLCRVLKPYAPEAAVHLLLPQLSQLHGEARKAV